MRHVREIIRLKFSVSIPTRDIARRLGLAPSTVRETLKRFEGSGLSWPLPDGMMDAVLEEALYANRRSKRGHRRHAEPDWPTVHRELKRKHVTLVIVWDEYIAANPGGYSYSRFCELYRGFKSKLSPTMRQTHAAGERLFVDYAGDGVAVVIDRLTGEIRKAQIFVAVLGTSSFTFARASWTQALSGNHKHTTVAEHRGVGSPSRFAISTPPRAAFASPRRFRRPDGAGFTKGSLKGPMHGARDEQRGRDADGWLRRHHLRRRWWLR